MIYFLVERTCTPQPPTPTAAEWSGKASCTFDANLDARNARRQTRQRARLSPLAGNKRQNLIARAVWQLFDRSRLIIWPSSWQGHFSFHLQKQCVSRAFAPLSDNGAENSHSCVAATYLHYTAPQPPHNTTRRNRWC